jgi:hypothetical protein
MRKEVMICGQDCHPGDGVCNNYCGHDKSKPLPDHPPEATKKVVYYRLRVRALIACDNADSAVEELRLAHNELFADGIIAGLQNMADRCDKRREMLNLLK